ncbi:MAG TPA: CopG family antitoxin, partial [Gemmataceae bacterium]|nr:CopG family antitoxin [Gemmataceae bacterium]
PKIDSVQELAEFWDTHDLTDFEDELEDVPGPVFVRGSALKVHLNSRESKTVRKMAEEKGVSPEGLIRAWVLQQLSRRNNGFRPSSSSPKSKKPRPRP